MGLAVFRISFTIPRFYKAVHRNNKCIRYAIRGILSQGTIRKDLPVAYTSRLLSTAEQNYSTIEKELLAIVYSVQFFRPYVYGRKFTLVTDHQPLKWLHSMKDPTSRFVRYRLKIAEYEYNVVYKAGKTTQMQTRSQEIQPLFYRSGLRRHPILEHHYPLLPISVNTVRNTKLRAISQR